MTNGRISTKGIWLWLLAVLPSYGINATEEVPCLIFTGNSPTSANFEIERFNRIYFHEEGFRIPDSNNPSEDGTILPYHQFHHLEFSVASPNITTGVSELPSHSNARLHFRDADNSIALINTEKKECSIEVFNLTGQHFRSIYTATSQYVSLSSLEQGAYIVTATAEGERYHLKVFIK